MDEVVGGVHHRWSVKDDALEGLVKRRNGLLEGLWGGLSNEQVSSSSQD